jgi:hypothetical protein
VRWLAAPADRLDPGLRRGGRGRSPATKIARLKLASAIARTSTAGFGSGRPGEGTLAPSLRDQRWDELEVVGLVADARLEAAGRAAQ